MRIAPAKPDRPSRRAFLRDGGALVLGFALVPRALAQGEKKESASPLPGSLKEEPMLDAWIRIDAHGEVSVFTGKAELGQGIKTALIQLAAEELVIDARHIQLITADTALTPNEMYTAGSHSMQDSGTAIRHAAAQVRELLVEFAAKRLGVTAERLRAQNGTVRADDGRRVGYGELVAGQALHVNAQAQSSFIPAKERRIIGTALARIDIPAKVTGGAAYVQDLRLPGMVHARVIRPPSYSARLSSVDTSAVQRMPGVIKIVRDGSFLAVVAQGEYQAIQAMRALAKAARWSEQASLPRQEEIFAYLQRSPAQDTLIAGEATGLPSSWTLEASYRRPFQIHGSVGPSCAVALLQGDALTIWNHSQGVYPLRDAIAEMLHMPAQRVRCVHMEGSGCYGHNGADDVAADAALVARAYPDRPVRVQWMREQEHTWEPFGPAMMSSAKAALDASGNITAWHYEVWSNTHSTRPGKAGHLAPARHLEAPFSPPPPKPLPQPEGGGDRNAIPLYTFARMRVIHHFLPDMPLRVSALRSLGAYMNIFSLESFMDELAQYAHIDPVEFRLRHMRDPRAVEVIRTAARHFGWSGYRPQRGRGRGFGFARYKNLAGYAAIALEVEVQHETGRIRVLRAVAAVDSGEVVNPDGLRNQIEGGVVQSLSWTLYEAVSFDAMRVTSNDWSSYPILRFSSVPAQVEVHIVDRPGEPFLGTGEIAQGPTAAALANALADATGVRMRELPLNPSRVKAALGV